MCKIIMNDIHTPDVSFYNGFFFLFFFCLKTRPISYASSIEVSIAILVFKEFIEAFRSFIC